jgi:PAS domain-containing protein
MPIERVVSATIGGQRRSLRVIDLPLGDDGVAGYAVDIEEMEELTRQFRRFRAAQRQMLDTMSAGIAQFDERRNLVFVNQPFLRLFNIPQAWVVDTPPFDRVLDRMRDAGRLPEVRDFPEWRRERQDGSSAARPRGALAAVRRHSPARRGAAHAGWRVADDVRGSDRTAPALGNTRHALAEPDCDVRQPVQIARRLWSGQPRAIVEPPLRRGLGARRGIPRQPPPRRRCWRAWLSSCAAPDRSRRSGR